VPAIFFLFPVFNSMFRLMVCLSGSIKNTSAIFTDPQPWAYYTNGTKAFQTVLNKNNINHFSASALSSSKFKDRVRAQCVTVSGHILQVRKADITEEDAEAIVNAANKHLMHGGGVAGAIVRKGGKVIQIESDHYVKNYGTVNTGNVVATSAGLLPAKYVIHAVGPIWKDGNNNEAELLKSATWNSLVKAQELKVNSIAFPAISSGIFGFPKTMCAEIMIRTAIQWTKLNNEGPPREIWFSNIDEETVHIFEQKLSSECK